MGGGLHHGPSTRVRLDLRRWPCGLKRLPLSGSQTVHDLGVREAKHVPVCVFPGRAPDGSDLPGDETWLTQPRSFLVIGHSEQLLGEEGGPHRDKIHAFEQFRRNLGTPEVITFDELLARAEWVVQVEGSVEDTDEDVDF